MLLAMLIQPVPAATASPTIAQTNAIFAAAGYYRVRSRWVGSCDDPGTPSYEPARIDTFRDINGDGHVDAIVIEGSAFCYGNIGERFTIVASRADGSWHRLHSETGIVTFQEQRGADGWPDIEVGGPGFCFPVLRWTGTSYQPHRTAYNGQPCRR